MELNIDTDEFLISENLKIQSLFTPEIVTKSNGIVADILKSLANKNVDDYLAVLNEGILYELKRFERGSFEYNQIDVLYQRTLNPVKDRWKVQSIDKVLCPYLFSAFLLMQQKKQEKPTNVNIMSLYHGTYDKNISSICKNNFNWRLQGTSKGHKFGHGISFAKRSTYACHYPDFCLELSRKLIVAQVLVGNYTTGSALKSDIEMTNSQISLIDDSGPLKNGNNSDSKNTVEDNSKPKERQLHIYWVTVILTSLLHLATLYGIYLGFTTAKLATVMFAFFTGCWSIFGITAGAHRLWSHRSYKVTWQLKCILLFGQTLAYQKSAINWARDHRTHHKWSDTDADPHNAKRGFFFSHIGWLFCKKLDDVIEKGKTNDLSDLFEDKLLRWQNQYYGIAMPIFCFLIPTSIPILLWNETFEEAFLVNIARFIICLHFILSINSFAHLWGSKPYDKNIMPSNNLFVTIVTHGEGWHNYHHAFPLDYKASEFGYFNLTTTLIDFFAGLGWAYDLKSVPKEMVKKKIDRTGDGSHNMVFERPISDIKG